MVARERIMSRLVRRQRDMSCACAEIIDAARKLEAGEQSVVILRYVKLKDGYRTNSLAEIARLIGYSTSQTKRLHASALEHLEKMIPNGPK
jgi:DNA-directed RNA polymerase specialized sigma subunit